MGASEWIWNGLPVPKAEDDVFPLPGEFFKGEKMSEELKFYSEDFLSSIDPDVVMRLNRTVHVFLQNKGGCGKTFCATLFAQFVGDVLGLPLRCFDLEQLSENGFAAFTSTLLNATVNDWGKASQSPVQTVDVELGITVETDWAEGIVYDVEL